MTSTFTPTTKTPEVGDTLALRVLRVFAFEYCSDVFWREDDGVLSMHVQCSDVFFWGSSDSEEITGENVDLLEETFAECEVVFGRYQADEAGVLFVARVRGERPQGAYYANLGDAWTVLFDACGPEREVGFGNPMTPEQAKDRATARRTAAVAAAHDRNDATVRDAGEGVSQ